MPTPPAAMLKGTLDLLILRTIELQPRHGLAVSERIAQITRGTFVVKPGSLFPALHRLEQEGYIAGAWGESAQGRRAKVYNITPAGRKRLTAERKSWDRIVTAVGQVLDPA